MLAVLARDSVILLLSASKMVRMYLFASSLLRYRGKEAMKCLRLPRIAFKSHPYTVQIGYSFGIKTVLTEGLEDVYLEQKTKKKDKPLSTATGLTRRVYNIDLSLIGC